MIIFVIVVALGVLDTEHLWLYVLGGIVSQLIYNSARKYQYCRVFLFYFGFQFIQIFCALLYAKFMNDNPEHLYEIPDIQWVIALSMIQLLLMFWVTVGLLNRFVAKQVSADFDDKISEIIGRMNTYRVVWIYIISTVLYSLLLIPFANNGSVRQIMDITNSFVYVFCIFLLSSYVIQAKGWDFKRVIVAVILLIGFILSFSSYFSTFKIFFICLLLASLGKLEKMSIKNYIGLGFLVSLLIYFMVFWSLVKIDYRFYTGTQRFKNQSVVASTKDGLTYLFDRFNKMNSVEFDRGVSSFFYRLQYMEYYSLVIKKIPAQLDFQQGKELMQTIEFLTTPRFLNPNKKILDPSAKVNKYTGRHVTTAKRAVSISIGYFGNLYIDFGFYLMTIPLIVLALMLYAMLRWIIKSFKANEYIKMSLVYSTVLVLGFFESDIDYYLGTVRNCLVLLLLLRRLPFKKIDAYLFSGEAENKPAPSLYKPTA